MLVYFICLQINILIMTNIELLIYPDNEGKWRWRATSSNGKIVGSSSQGFSSKQYAAKNAAINGFIKA